MTGKPATDQPTVSENPVFWYRPRSDGSIEGPILDSLIEEVRKASGAWVPLFAGPQPDRVAELEAEVERLRKDAERYQQVRRGQKWSVIDGIGATLRGERLDDAIDAALPGKEAQS